jgi:uncharacterized protein (TIGR01244 family)
MRRGGLNAYIRAHPKRFKLVAGAAIIAAIALLVPGKSTGEVPFGEEVGSLVSQYDRRTPEIASSGAIDDSGYGRLGELGFAAVIDLRVPEEGGIEEARDAAEARGMRYFNVPMGHAVPSPEEIAEFARIVEDEANRPVLFYGPFANRAGAMWALYRAHRGVPPAQAYEEGRTAGLKGLRAKAVREALGLE